MTADFSWDDRRAAAEYAVFTREFPLYQRLNRELVRMARLATAERVLDLACGSGATARAALRRLPEGAELVGVDASPTMVPLARAEVEDPRASFRVAAAAQIGQVLDGSFDRVLCNAAFWQFPSLEEVIRSVAGILRPGGRFVFNLPVSRLEGDTQGGELQTRLARAVEKETNRPFRPSTVELDAVRLEEMLTSHGFSPPERTRLAIPTTEGEILELLRLPTMIGRIAPDLDVEARRRVLNRVAENVRPDRRTEVEWEIWSQGLDG